MSLSPNFFFSIISIFSITIARCCRRITGMLIHLEDAIKLEDNHAIILLMSLLQFMHNHLGEMRYYLTHEEGIIADKPLKRGMR